MNDAGTTWQAPVSLYSGGTVQNTKCLLNGNASSMTGSGSNLTVNLAITFFQPESSGTKNIFMEVSDASQNSGWQKRGVWTVP
jgi:hypothetical protein